MTTRLEALDCGTVQAWASALLDGELPATQVDAIHAHFRGCSACARFYQGLREQLVLHRWTDDAVFELEAADACFPDDIPDYTTLALQLRAADLGAAGRLLYEILKAEFLFDYGDDIEVTEEPIADPRAERQRGMDMVEELRDWHDADEVDGVDLVDVGRRLRPPTFDQNRLDALLQGMGVVATTAPALVHHAHYYQALAHYKAGRIGEAEALFGKIAAEAEAGLARQAEVTLVSLPVETADPAQAIEPLRRALRGDGFDALLWFNLAKAHFLAGGRTMSADVRAALDEARSLDPDLVERQLERPSERGMRG